MVAPVATPPPKIHVHVLKSLTASLIIRCLEDLQRWNRCHADRQNKGYSDSLRAARHAIRWLGGWQQADGISFVECCDTLKFNPDASRERILALIDSTALDACGGWQRRAA